MPDTRHSTEEMLDDVERQLDVVDARLLATDPTGLEAACTDLRRLALSFAGVLEAALSAEVFDNDFRRRIEAVAQRMGTQRESLARRNVVVERALASILRPRPGATYAPRGERSGFGAASRGFALGMH